MKKARNEHEYAISGFFSVIFLEVPLKYDEKIAWCIYEKAIDLLEKLSYNLINKNKQIRTQSNKK